MNTTLSKQDIQKLKSERFKKSPQEKLDLKKAKSDWKRLNPKKK
jgi:hypothetical protein